MAAAAWPSPPRAGRTPRPRFDLADVLRQHGDVYLQTHPAVAEQRRVVHALTRCRTAALGGHLERCDACGHERPAYNSCRNRHCAKCQTLATVEWLAARRAELLPVGYFHTVFTLPHALNGLAARNPRLVYSLLFHCAATTLQAFAHDPRHHLGGDLGFLAVLHTWDQQLRYHVHLHCVIAGGVLTADDAQWVPARARFLFPVKALARAFRRRLLDGLAAAAARGDLVLPPAVSGPQLASLLADLRRQNWVVYCKPPFDGPERVLTYLSRYTHRIAISNHRLTHVDETAVSFTYHDRPDGNRVKTLSLPVDTFLGRFLQHVLPSGFVRLRHYGFLASRTKDRRLARCRLALKVASLPPTVAGDARSAAERFAALTGIDVTRCPHCHQGTMRIAYTLIPSPGPAPPIDSS